MFCQPCSRTLFERRCRVVIRCMQNVHAGAEPHRIERVDRECSMTALRAARATCQPMAGTMSSIDKSKIDNLHKVAVAVWKLHNRKDRTRRGGRPGESHIIALS